MLTPETFLADIEAYLKEVGMTPTTFGKQAVGDPNFVFDLRDGRVCNLAIVAKVQKAILAGRAELASDGGEAKSGEAA